jgi:acyl dehydratase
MPRESSGPYTVGYRFGKEHAFDPDQVKAFALLAGDTNPLHNDGPRVAPH